MVERIDLPLKKKIVNSRANCGALPGVVYFLSTKEKPLVPKEVSDVNNLCEECVEGCVILKMNAYVSYVFVDICSN